MDDNRLKNRETDLSLIEGMVDENPHKSYQSRDDFEIVKIASNWKRRDCGLPKWWADHLRSLFR